jgi:hypothetical protein
MSIKELEEMQKILEKEKKKFLTFKEKSMKRYLGTTTQDRIRAKKMLIKTRKKESLKRLHNHRKKMNDRKNSKIKQKAQKKVDEKSQLGSLYDYHNEHRVFRDWKKLKIVQRKSKSCEQLKLDIELKNSPKKFRRPNGPSYSELKKKKFSIFSRKGSSVFFVTKDQKEKEQDIGVFGEDRLDMDDSFTEMPMDQGERIKMLRENTKMRYFYKYFNSHLKVSKRLGSTMQSFMLPRQKIFARKRDQIGPKKGLKIEVELEDEESEEEVVQERAGKFSKVFEKQTSLFGRRKKRKEQKKEKKKNRRDYSAYYDFQRSRSSCVCLRNILNK